MTVAHDVVDDAQKRISNLARENAKLKKEANRLRAKVQPGQWDRVLENAYEDARLILHLRHSGTPVSRRTMNESGLISQYRYGWALGLLRYARVDRYRVATLEDLDQAMTKLEGSVEWLRENATDRLMEVRVKCSKAYILGRYS